MTNLYDQESRQTHYNVTALYTCTLTCGQQVANQDIIMKIDLGLMDFVEVCVDLMLIILYLNIFFLNQIECLLHLASAGIFYDIVCNLVMDHSWEVGEYSSIKHHSSGCSCSLSKTSLFWMRMLLYALCLQGGSYCETR